MTAETYEYIGVSEGSKVEVEEFEEKSVMNLNPCEDLVNVGGDCNGIAHGEEEIGPEAKDETDASYVFVNCGSDDHEERDLDVVDPLEDLDRKSTAEENGEAELNAGSSSEQTMVESEVSKEEKGETVESCVDNGCMVEENVVSSGAESEELREEKGENGESCLANHFVVEECSVFLSVDGSHDEPNRDDMEGNVIVEGQKKLELVVDVEENQDSQITAMDVAESEESREEKGENGESCVTIHCVVEEGSVFLSVDGSHDEPNRDGVEGNGIVEGQKKLEMVEDSQVTSMDVAESEELREENGENDESCVTNHCVVEESSVFLSVDGLHDEPNRDDMVEGQKKLELVVEVEENQDSQITAMEGVEHELHTLEKGKETETSNIADEIIVDGSARDLGMEWKLKPQTAGCPVADTKLETEVGDGPVHHAELHAEVTNGSVVSNELAIEVRHVSDESGKVETENGSVGGDSMLACPVAVLYPEAEIAIESVEGGEVMTHCSVDDLGLESQVRYASFESSESVNICSLNGTELASVVTSDSIGNDTNLPISPVNGMESEGEVENGSARSGECLPSRHFDVLKSENEDRNGYVETGESFLACPVNEESEIEDTNNGHVESGETCCVDDSKSKTEATGDYVGTSEILVTCPVDTLKLETKAVNGHSEFDKSLPTCPIDEESEAKFGKDHVESGQSLPTCPVYEESEADVQKDLVENNKGMRTCNVNEVKLESEVKNDFAESIKSALVCAPDVIDVDNEDQLTNKDDGDDKTTCEEAERIEGIPSVGSLQPSPEDSSAAAMDGLKVDAEVGKKLPNFIIRIPRYVDDVFGTQIKMAQLQVDVKTQHRDSIGAVIQLKKATCSEYWEKFEATKLEERAARDAVSAKRQEIDSIQSVINRMKNASSIEEIEERIHNMDHMIEHETMPLKEEKQLIREIKQLKHAREQLCASMGTQAEIQQAFDQRDSIEERFKLLKQELDSCRNEVLRTERITKAAKKKHYDEGENLRELLAQFKAANDLRQEAYAHLKKLKKQLYEKSKYFYMYKEDKSTAADYASRAEREALQRLCTNQVEKIMELWNNNDEFRKDYVKHNMMSMLRRFKTLDGTSLGPNEEPLVLRNLTEEKNDASHLASAEIRASLVVPAPDMKQEKSGVPVAPEGTVAKSEMGQKNLVAKSKKTSKLTSETVPVTVSTREDIVEGTEKESKGTKEEEERARKEEELRKEEAAAKLKEERRLEEKAKAKEAEERKRRNAEKAQARAELRAQKEAEFKEKEREKRLRKKERRKVVAAGTVNGCIEGVTAEVSDNNQPEAIRVPEFKDKAATVTKRPPKPLPVAKQTMTKPLPLRNRGKRKMQPWMWVLLIAVLLLAVFLMGNTVSSFKFGLSSFGF